MSTEIYNNLKQNILNDVYPTGKLPTERALAEEYEVTRNTIKNVVNQLEEEGLVFKKQRSGVYINLLFKENHKHFSHSLDEPIGVTKTFSAENDVESEILEFKVIRPEQKILSSLVLKENEFVYYIKRVRILNQEPISIEEAFIPIKHLPELNLEHIKNSLFVYAEQNNFKLSNSYLSVYADSSSKEDQKYLGLSANEPVSIIEEIILTDTGVPFEFSIIRNHYKKFMLNTVTKKKTDKF